MAKYKILITDIAWNDLTVEKKVLAEADAEIVLAERQDKDHLVALAKQCDAILTCWAQTPQEVIAASTHCQVVSRFGIGLDNIDVAHCTSRGIPVTNVPDYCCTEVAEHALALILALGRKVAHFHHETKQGVYDLGSGPPMRRLQGQNLGVIGYGNIGRALATRAQAMGMNVLVAEHRNRTFGPHVTTCTLEQLLRQADFISLHTPLTNTTKHLLSQKHFSLMKPTAYLINTARGDLVDHAALATALKNNQLAGAGLDVQTPEPPDLQLAPFNDPRVIVTPHAAFVSEESVEELRRRATENVTCCLRGERPEHVVNPEVYVS